MSIRFNEAARVFSLETEGSLYQMKIAEGGVLLHLYYGRRTGADMSYLLRTADRGFSGNPYAQRHNRGFSLDTLPQEYPGCGVGDYRLPAAQAIQANGSRSVDLRYAGHRVLAGKRDPQGLPHVRGDHTCETLEITLMDSATGLTALLYYSVFPEKDAIVRSARLENRGKAPMTLTRAASVAVDFPCGRYEALHFHGRHCMERMPERVKLPRGTVAFGSRRGMSSHHSNPFVILCDPRAGEDAGDCYGFMLAYSGNHLEEIEVDQAGSVRLVAGIHPDGFAWPLQPGEGFDAPEAILAYSAGGFNGLSAHYHDIIRENVLPPRFREGQRPILLNSWEACYFDFDAERIVRLAEDAKALGVEMLVLDDGWFGVRNDDNSGLGDWAANEGKLGCSLGALSERIHALGLRFGLWFEPEMISEDSDLFRAHPDWALRDPDRDPCMARNQLVLDMSRREVVDHIYAAMCAVLDGARIEYIKWDFNRSMANLYSAALPPDEQGTVAHRFMLGTYDLLARLSERYPELMIEGCAGGGGRFDAGMLFYCPQIWCSDDTDAIERLEIQRGTSYGYPASAMGSHVSAVPNHQTGRTVPLAARNAVAQSGTFGYELNPALLSEEEKAQIRKQIGDYRRFQPLIAHGDYYRLGELEEDGDFEAWMFVSKDRREALVNLVARHHRANGPFPFARLRGLDPGAEYRLGDAGGTATGAALMYGGYAFGQLFGDYPAAQLHLTRI